MADFGLTGAGFAIKRLADVKESLDAKMGGAFGEVNLAPDSPLGQIVGIFSESIADVWAQMEMIYLAMYPSSAEGFSLDNAVQFNGIARQNASSATCKVLLIGDEGTLVPAERQIENSLNSEIFKTVDEITIGVANVARIVVDVDSPSVIPFLYSVSIDSNLYSYTSIGGDTEESISSELVNQINTTQPLTAEQVTATDNLDGTFSVLVDDKETNLAIVLSANLTATEIGTSVLTESENTGVITAPIGTLDTIVTPVTGWDSVTNIIAATIGREVESDLELRARRRMSLSKLGNASIPAMTAKILDDILGVTACTIIENDTEIDYTGTGGLPPHSIRCIVQGGTNQDVAKKIWDIKAGGIQTNGNTTEIIVDSEGKNRTINFTRPLPVYGYINIVVTKITDGTEVFPADGIQGIIDAVEEFGSGYDIGEDILIQRFYSAIFAVQGVKSAVVTVDMNPTWNPSYTPSYSASDISIDPEQVVVWSQDVTKQIIVTAP